MIWRWRRQSVICSSSATPWTVCCHAASSHLDVVSAAFLLLRLHTLREKSSPCPSPAHVCVIVSHLHRFAGSRRFSVVHSRSIYIIHYIYHIVQRYTNLYLV